MDSGSAGAGWIIVSPCRTSFIASVILSPTCLIPVRFRADQAHRLTLVLSQSILIFIGHTSQHFGRQRARDASAARECQKIKAVDDILCG